MLVMFYRLPSTSNLFPTIGLRIITEPSSPEDLPDLETQKISIERVHHHTFAAESKHILKISSGRDRHVVIP
jgi:hypothetical protein